MTYKEWDICCWQICKLCTHVWCNIELECVCDHHKSGACSVDKWFDTIVNGWTVNNLSFRQQIHLYSILLIRERKKIIKKWDNYNYKIIWKPNMTIQLLQVLTAWKFLKELAFSDLAIFCLLFYLLLYSVSHDLSVALLFSCWLILHQQKN